MKQAERRVADLDAIEVRAAKDGEPAKLTGHAAVFNKLSDDLGGFRERIAEGAFTDSLANDVRALFNHDPSLLLGRTKAGTLKIAEDRKGLKVEIDAPDTQVGRDVMTSVERGDISQMSFGFYVLDDQFERKRDGSIIRQINKVDLFDVSAVTFPAYPQTDISLRSFEAFKETLSAAERAEVEGQVDKMKRHLALMARDLT